MRKNILHFALLLLLISGCAKKDNPPQNNPTLTLEKPQYYPLEVAQLSVENITLTDSIYSGTINSNALQFRNCSGKLMFFVPTVAAGNYSIKILIAETEYAVALTVIDLPAIADPLVYLQEAITQNDSTTAGITLLADTLDPAIKTAVLNDLQTVNTMLTTLYAQYNTLTPAEKAECAKVLAANKWWLDEVNAANDVLLADVASYKTEFDVADYEQRVKISMGLYLTAVAAVVRHIPKIAFLTAAGGLLGSIIPILGTGVGASVGAGIAIGCMLIDVQTLMACEERFLNTAIVTTDDIFANKTASIVNFTNNVEKQLVVTMNYRTVYQGDQTAPVPIASQLINGMASLSSAFLSLKSYLPSSLRSPKLIGDVPAYKVLNLPVHSSYLTVTRPSGYFDVYIANINKTNGLLLVTLTNFTYTDQSFNLIITYSNADFGSHTKIIDANITNDISTVMDIDSNVYNVVKIGNQYWMKENLKTTRFQDGSLITEAEDSASWTNVAGNPAWCYQDGNAANNAAFGKIYNGFVAVDPRNVCPAGWMVPSKAIFTELVDYLGGEYVAGGKMLDPSTLWHAAYAGSNNSSGFTALPVNYRGYMASFLTVGYNATFWSSTIENSSCCVYDREISGTSFTNSAQEYKDGLAIRCVRY